jgi:hypothetical protein
MNAAQVIIQSPITGNPSMAVRELAKLVLQRAISGPDHGRLGQAARDRE